MPVDIGLAGTDYVRTNDNEPEACCSELDHLELLCGVGALGGDAVCIL